VLAIAANHVKIPLRRRLAAAPMRAASKQPPMRPRWSLCLALVAVAAMLAGCGGAASPTNSDRSKIREVVAGFLYAVARGAGAVACAQATPAGQTAIVSALGPELQNFGIYGCKNTVAITGEQMKPAARRALETETTGVIKIDSAKATISLSQITSPYGSVAGELGTKGPIRLVESSGVWLISAL
jgi:hypothetical protein